MIVLFWDIDGTLLTTGRAGIFAWEDAVRDVCGGEPDFQALFTSGLTDAQISELVLEVLGREASPVEAKAVLRAYERRLPEVLPRRQGRVLPGVLEVLEDLEGRDDVRSLLLTGNTPAGAQAKLARYGLDRFFPDGSGSFCLGPGERAEIARRALTLVDDAASVYVIGDTPHDVEAGKAIGARTIAVASGWHSPEELTAADPWVVLEQIPDPAAFRRLIGLDDR